MTSGADCIRGTFGRLSYILQKGDEANDHTRNGKFYGSSIEQPNIAHIVGVGGKAINETNDVMLSQALCKLIGYTELRARQWFGVGITDLPEPKGIFDDKTIKAIWEFQKRLAHSLLNVDGKIHPANYKNRAIKLNGPLMTITLLNIMASFAANDFIPDLKQIAPKLVLTRVAP